MHVPVMVSEILSCLEPERGGPYWDLTVGAGGHLRAFLARAPAGTAAYGLDGDPGALARTADVEATVVHGDLGDLRGVTATWPRPRAVLMDLGLSSMQVDQPERGFSFRHDGPLDMRMDPTQGVTAAEWLDDVTEAELARVLRELGEERYAGRIARVVKESLPLGTTVALADAVLKAVGRHKDPFHHPARRTFQAIRMAVNRELERIEAGLEDAVAALLPGGRVAVLSYHSGEDRVVKHALRDAKQAGLVRLLTRKPLSCSDAEARENPRARSALLRTAERI